MSMNEILETFLIGAITLTAGLLVTGIIIYIMLAIPTHILSLIIDGLLIGTLFIVVSFIIGMMIREDTEL